MDIKIVSMMFVSLAAMVLFLIFLKKSRFISEHKALFEIIFGALIASQIFSIMLMVNVAGVFEPSPPLSKETSVQNSSAKILRTLLTKDDFSSDWKWETINIIQPSNLPWIGSTVESANLVLVAKTPHFVIFKHYVRITQNAQLYGSILSENEFNKWIPIQSIDETSFSPQVNKKGKYFYVMCSEGSDFYSCDVSMGYDYFASSIWIMTPQDMGKQYVTDLINSAIALTDQRVIEFFQ